MGKAIEIKETRIHCDNCNDEFVVERDEFMKYHNKECEKCGCVLINDDDVKVFNATTELYNVVNNICGDVTGHSDMITLDSTELLKAQKKIRREITVII